jgi:gas vesicle protein
VIAWEPLLVGFVIGFVVGFYGALLLWVLADRRESQ